MPLSQHLLRDEQEAEHPGITRSPALGYLPCHARCVFIQCFYIVLLQLFKVVPHPPELIFRISLRVRPANVTVVGLSQDYFSWCVSKCQSCQLLSNTITCWANINQLFDVVWKFAAAERALFLHFFFLLFGCLVVNLASLCCFNDRSRPQKA